MAIHHSDICDDFLTAYPLRNFIPFVSGGVGIGGLVLGVIYFLSASAAIYWIHQQRKNAMGGMQGAARHVVLPFYVPLLYLSAVSDVFVGLVIVFINTNFDNENGWTNAGVVALAFSFQHMVIEGTAFILMQYGCGYQAVINTATWGVMWSIATFFVYLLLYKDANRDAYAVEACWNAILLLFYTTLWLMPEKKLFRRSAVIYYARYWAIIRGSIIFATVSVHFGPDYMVLLGDCVYDLGILPLFLILKPYILYQSLLIDSQWWQGLEGVGMTTRPPPRYATNTADNSGQSTWQSTTSAVKRAFRYFRQGARRLMGYRPNPQHEKPAHYEAIRGPLLGVEVGFSEAQGLAREVDSMHKEGTIKLLNFAYLKVDQRQKLGAGSFSTVYTGMYKHTPVAIKMLVTLDLNPDVIRRCNNEARILTEVSPHPNVVTIYGLAVLPPSVCLVLEICEFGSLSDALRGCQISGHTRTALRLSLADRMFLALGCARGLQALHNYSPSLCHRDIKSFNFLIDSQLNAKIADLDLGDDLNSSDPNYIVNAHNKKSGVYECRPDSVPGGSGHSPDRGAMGKIPNYTGTNMTWQAPEVLLGMGYTQMSDIYSLGLVFWEIIASGRTKKKYTSARGGMTVDEAYDSVPYSDCKSQQEIREKIVRGLRPSLVGYTPSVVAAQRAGSICNPFTTNGTVDQLYVDMVKLCWQTEALSRPSIREIVSLLEECYHNCLHRHVLETKHLVNADIVHAEHLRLSLLHRGVFTRPLSSFVASSAAGQGSAGIPSAKGNNPHISHHFSNALSAEFISNISVLKLEPQWAILDNNNHLGYLILCAKSPFYILYTNKRYQQTTGHVLMDLLAQEFESLLGNNPVNNVESLNASNSGSSGGAVAQPPFLNIDSKGSELRDKIRERLRLVAEFGIVEHAIANMTRRDGREVLCSLHFYPVYQAQEDVDSYYVHPDTSQNNLFSDPSPEGSETKSIDEAECGVGSECSGDCADLDLSREEDGRPSDLSRAHSRAFTSNDSAPVPIPSDEDQRNMDMCAMSDAEFDDGVDRRDGSSLIAHSANSKSGSYKRSGPTSWTDSFMQTLTNSYHRLPFSARDSNKESITALASSNSTSTSNMLLLTTDQHKRRRKKVVYVVVEVSPLRSGGL